MYQSFKGGLGGIALAKHGRSRAINAENPHGEKGKGGILQRPHKYGRAFHGSGLQGLD